MINIKDRYNRKLKVGDQILLEWASNKIELNTIIHIITRRNNTPPDVFILETDKHLCGCVARPHEITLLRSYNGKLTRKSQSKLMLLKLEGKLI